MKMKLLAASISLACAQSALATPNWESLNPGAGGQIQDVVADPNTANVVYLASDMEGVYKSLDNGMSWKPTGQLVQNRVYAVAVAPGDANTVYAGSLYGLHISEDGGDNYRFVEATRNRSIGAIAFKPSDKNTVLAGPGWRDDDDFIDHFGEQANGTGTIFRSTDGGDSWTEIVFDSDTGSDRNVYTISFNPANDTEIYLGTNKGVYRSADSGASWSKVAAPNATHTRSKGVAVSPDGSKLYGVFAGNGNDWTLYATAAVGIDWQPLMNGLDADKRYWYPEVDPRSSGNEHKVLLGTLGDRAGLFEAQISWNGDQVESYSWARIFHEADGSFDIGWDHASPANARFAHYTPDSGGWTRGVWSTTNQAMFFADYSAGNNSYQWSNRYSEPNNAIQVSWWGKLFPTYSGRGTESTYTYDVAVHGDYVIQGQGDNGLVESWDGGVSWSNMQHRRADGNLSDVQAVAIADAWGVPTVVAQATGGYGGAAVNGRLWAKKLVHHSPLDEWVEIGGGVNAKAGLPDGVFRDVAVSPMNPAKVFAFSTNHGLYVIDDIGRALAYEAEGKSISAKRIYRTTDNTSARIARTIAPHPTDEKVVFFSSTSGAQGVWRGEEQQDGSWDFERVLDTRGWDAEVHAWEYDGQVYLLNFASGGSGFENDNHWHLLLSKDEGQTWEKVFSPSDAQALRPTSLVKWWDDVNQQFTFSAKGGATGFANKLMLSYYDHRQQVGYGVFEGTLDENGSIAWADITGDLHFSGMTNTRYVMENGGVNLYAATPGAGLWRTNVTSVDLPAAAGAAPAAPDGLSAILDASRNEIQLTWQDNTDVETGFRIERSTGGAFVTVGQVGRDTEAFIDFDLAANTEYRYRIVAFNALGVSDTSNEVTQSSGNAVDPIPECNPDNLLINGDFSSGVISPWNFYVNTGAGADASHSIGSFNGYSSGQVLDIDLVASASANDVQLQNSFGLLEAGVTYELSFTASADAARSFEVKIHQAQAPWQNVKEGDVIQVDAAPVTYTIEYTPASSLGALSLGFFLGNDLTSVQIDEVSLKQACETPTPTPAPAPTPTPTPTPTPAPTPAPTPTSGAGSSSGGGGCAVGSGSPIDPTLWGLLVLATLRRFFRATLK